MKKYPYNILLAKDDVGKTKPTVRNLPNRNFIYGKPEVRDKEGVGEGNNLLITYQFHQNGFTIKARMFQNTIVTSKN